MHQWLQDTWQRIRQYRQRRNSDAASYPDVYPTPPPATRMQTGCLFFVTDERRSERLLQLFGHYAKVYSQRIVLLTDDSELYHTVHKTMGSNHWIGHLMPLHSEEKEWKKQSHILFESIAHPGPMVFVLHTTHKTSWRMAWLTQWIDAHYITQFIFSHPGDCAYVNDIMECGYGWPYWEPSTWSKLVTQHFATPVVGDAQFWQHRTYQLYLAFNTIRLRWFSHMLYGDYHDLRNSVSLDFWIKQIRRQPSSFVSRVLHNLPGVAWDFSNCIVQSQEQFSWLCMGWINPRRLSIAHYNSTEGHLVLHRAQSEQAYMENSYFLGVAQMLAL